MSSNKAIRQFLKDLDRGIGDKMSLLKMLVIKCDEADQNFNRLRNAINYGEIESADRILCDLQQQNGSSLSDIQNEISEGTNLIQTVGQLSQMITRELNRAKSTGRAQANVINQAVGDHSPLRSVLKNSVGSDSGINRNLNQTFKQNDRIEQLQRQLIELQTENDRLKHESQIMVVNYSRQIDTKEDAIRNLKSKLNALDGDNNV